MKLTKEDLYDLMVSVTDDPDRAYLAYEVIEALENDDLEIEGYCKIIDKTM